MNDLISVPDEQPPLQLDAIGIIELKQIQKWTALLSILGFLFLALIVLISIVALVDMSGVSDSQRRLVTVVPLILIGIVYFFPILYLWKFSKHSNESIANNDTSKLTSGLKYLKLHYRFMAILILIVAMGYLLAGVAMLVSGKFGQF